MLLQGVANLIWAYAKLASPPVESISKIMNYMKEMLENHKMKRISGAGKSFDAQAGAVLAAMYFALACQQPHVRHMVLITFFEFLLNKLLYTLLCTWVLLSTDPHTDAAHA